PFPSRPRSPLCSLDSRTHRTTVEMRFPNMLRSRAPEVRSEPRVEFLGEQDGPPERALKSALTEIFARRSQPVRAYLARRRLPNRQRTCSCLMPRWFSRTRCCPRPRCECDLLEDVRYRRGTRHHFPSRGPG